MVTEVVFDGTTADASGAETEVEDGDELEVTETVAVDRVAELLVALAVVLFLAMERVVVELERIVELLEREELGRREERRVELE